MANELSVYFQNVRGLRSKTKSMFLNSAIGDFDIICCVETWLNSSVSSSELFDPTLYAVYRIDRNPKTSTKVGGGGSLIAVKTSLQVIRPEWCVESIEQVWVSVQCNLSGIKEHVCSIYIPPSQHIQVYTAFFEKLLQLIEKYPKDKFLICGDFNLPGITWKPSEINSYCDVYSNSTTNLLDDCIYWIDCSGLYQFT